MEFQDVVRHRRMVRNFEDRPVPEATLDRILENAVRAPSAGFSQGWAFLVLEGEERKRFHDVTFPAHERKNFRFHGVMRSPAVIVCLSHRDTHLDRYAAPDKGWTDHDPARSPVPD